MLRPEDQVSGVPSRAFNRFATKRSVRIGLIVWAGVAAIGWLGYALFLAGAPGFHWLAFAYSRLLVVTFVVVLTSLLTLPILGLAFGVLALVSTQPQWRSRTRQGAQKLLVILLLELLLLVALMPNAIVQYQPYVQQAIAPWQVVYRAIYVSPLDDNYGDLMLLKCHWLGLCHQVYRSYTDITSAEGAELNFNAQTQQVALYLEGRWVYVRSPNTEPCQEILRSSDPYGKCRFVPEP